MSLGQLLLVLLVLQGATGVVATFGTHSPFSELLNTGETASHLFHKLHKAGAHCVFALLYLHLAQKMMERAYMRTPITWVAGIILAILMLLIAGTGQLIALSNNGYWGLVVVYNALRDLPFLNMKASRLLPQDVNSTLMFYLHISLPALMMVAFIPHALSGSSATKTKVSSTFKNKRTLLSASALILITTALLWKNDGYIAPDPNYTPKEVGPAWYLRPLYVLFSHNDSGAIILSTAIVMLLSLLLPPLHRCLYNATYKRISSILITILMMAIISPSIASLAGIGYKTTKTIGTVCSVYYFVYFFTLIILFLYKKLVK